MKKIIDRDSPIPAYYQVQMDIKQRISRGEWAEIGQLPSEKNLSDEYEVSRVTLRQALAELEKDGAIKKARGRGAMICEKPAPFDRKLDYYSIASAKNSQITSQMLHIERFDTPMPDIAERLQIAANSPIVYMKRIFLYEKKAIAIGRSWLSLERFPNLDTDGLNAHGLAETLYSRYQVEIKRVDDSIEAVRPTQSERNLLDITYDCPLLLIRGLSIDTQDKPVEYSTTLWIGDAVRFSISLNTSPLLMSVQK